MDERGKPWDFSAPEMRDKARKLVKSTKPMLLIGSPMCREWSVLQNLNRDRRCPAKYAQRMREARVHLAFVIELYKMQSDQGRYWLHEHPKSARSWKETNVVELLMRKDSILVEGHMCQFGLVSSDERGGGAVLKPTYFATNCRGVADQLERKCSNNNGPRDHRHVPLLNGRAKKAGEYPPGLCEAICRGLVRQIEVDHSTMSLVAEMILAEGKGAAKMQQKELNHLASKIAESMRGGAKVEEDEEWEEAWDDVKQKELKPGKVREARRVEMEYIRKRNLYNKVPRSKCYAQTRKPPVKSMWLDTNKGDEENENYRSRFVGKEFNTSKNHELFAATPPLEALRMLVSDLCTVTRQSDRSRRMMVCDVSRAFFYAPIETLIYVELPEEDREPGKDEVAELNFSLYGTRQAAANWHKAYSEHLISIGFKQGEANPCLFVHAKRGIKALVHGDDYVAVGEPEGLRWMKTEVGKRFEIKTKVFGPDKAKGEQSEVSMLGRILEWHRDGVTYEADPRHAEKIVRELGLEHAKGLSTPGVKPEKNNNLEREIADTGVELTGAKTTQYRAVAARLNYLALDRPDLAYAAKEASRRMSKPVEQDFALLKHAARYLRTKPRAVVWYKWQDQTCHVDGYTDSDWAGCRKTRKSTTGGVLMQGGHWLKAYSKTQPNIALSSGEAELYAIVKASAEVLGICSMWKDLGTHTKGRVWADASAALGIVGRKGLGKVRHLDTSVLWVQDASLTKKILYAKVAGEWNIADLLTKHLDAETSGRHSEAIGVEFKEGTSRIAIRLDSVTRHEKADGERRQEEDKRRSFSCSKASSSLLALCKFHSDQKQSTEESSNKEGQREDAKMVKPHTRHDNNNSPSSRRSRLVVEGHTLSLPAKATKAASGRRLPPLHPTTTPDDDRQKEDNVKVQDRAKPHLGSFPLLEPRVRPPQEQASAVVSSAFSLRRRSLSMLCLCVYSTSAPTRREVAAPSGGLFGFAAVLDSRDRDGTVGMATGGGDWNCAAPWFRRREPSGPRGSATISSSSVAILAQVQVGTNGD